MAVGNSHHWDTGTASTGLRVSQEGDADPIKKAFANSRPEKLDDLITQIDHVYRMARDTMGPEIDAIRADLLACWEGDEADTAVATIGDFKKNADEIRDTAHAVSTSLSTFQTHWSNLKAQAAGIDTGNSVVHVVTIGAAGGADDGTARDLFHQFVNSANIALQDMPNSLEYYTPLTPGTDQDGQAPGPGAHPGYGGGAPSVPGPGPGPGIHTPGIHPPGINDVGLNPPGTNPPGTNPPGTNPPGTNPPGTNPPYVPGVHYPGPGHGPGSSPAFSSGHGFGPGHGGVGIDTGSSLAGVGGGPGPGGLDGGVGGGLGGGGAGGGLGGGLGGGPGSGLAGGVAGGAGAGAGAGGAGGGLAGGAAGGGGAGPGRGMMMPMHGANGGGDDERERSTWLEEDEDVWGAGDAPPGVIT